MKRIVQFSHPKDKPGAPERWISASEGWREWNCRREHNRKFIWSEGSLTPNRATVPHHGTFAFWGEWEPQSRVRKLTQQTQHDPRWLHTPELNLDVLKTIATHSQPSSCTTNCTTYNGPQNTDPLVFGDRFRYAFCKQESNKILRSLSKGDIILFGSTLAKSFVIDTVFVVGEHDIVHNNVELPSWESELHRRITMDLIQVPTCGLRLYGGERWSPEKPFSFVPCLPAKGLPTVGFRRPVIDASEPLKDIINPRRWRGPPPYVELDDKSADAAWEAIVQQVVDWGCALGTTVDEPCAL
jgi:hypothetical protein